MAFSFNTTLLSFLLAPFLFTGLANARLVDQKAAANDLISDICKQTHNPPACLAALRSDPGSAKADLRGLGHISIGLARKSSKSTYQLIEALIKGGKYKSIEGSLDGCQENYDDAIHNLDATEKFLNSGDFKSMSEYAAAALNGPDDCDGGFEVPSEEPPQLKKANQDVENLISIILAIASRLGGGGALKKN